MSVAPWPNNSMEEKNADRRQQSMEDKELGDKIEGSIFAYDYDVSEKNDFEEIFEKNIMVDMMHDFFTEPHSSRPAYLWSMLTFSLAIARFMGILLETVDGPNQYYGQAQDVSRFKFLLDIDGYWTLRLTCMIPLFFDTFFRVLCLLLVFFRKENTELAEKLLNEPFHIFLHLASILGVIPTVIVILQDQTDDNSGADVGYLIFLRAFDLLNCSHIIRFIKDIPPILAIRIALAKAGPHLVLPAFFFMIFNITLAVLFYMLEPCFNYTSCPWQDFFDSNFYTIVTMTTTGYGNQVPNFEYTRFLGCFVMIFGALFMSMPLAILGNEYSEAWTLVKAQVAEKKSNAINASRARRESILGKEKLKLAAESKAISSSSNDGNKDENGQPSSTQTIIKDRMKNVMSLLNIMADEEDLDAGVTEKDKSMISDQISISGESLIAKSETNVVNILKESRINWVLGTSNSLSPIMIFHLCELYSALSDLLSNIEGALFDLNEEVKSGPKSFHRLSVFGGSTSLAEFASQISSGDQTSATVVPIDEPPPTNKHEQAVSELKKKEAALKSMFLEISGNANGNANSNGNGDASSTSTSKSNSKVDAHIDLEIRTRSDVPGFAEMMQAYHKNPRSTKNRIWLLCNLPHSSRQARFLQLITIFIIYLSIFMLYTESLSSLMILGENTPICGSVLEVYCSDKDNSFVDPGCFVLDQFSEPTNQKLQFDCTGSNCFGHGFNFGSDNTNATCSNSLSPPFQSSYTLLSHYGPPTLVTTRNLMHRLSPICTRVECRSQPPPFFDVNYYSLRFEVFCNLYFTLESLVRLWANTSYSFFFQDKMNWFDIISIVPFYTEISLNGMKPLTAIDFSILSSAPNGLTMTCLRACKVFRLFKLTRHFSSSKILFETAATAWKQILGILVLMCCLVTLFAIILYEVERGTPCFVGEPNCHLPPVLPYAMNDGYRVLINKNGGFSQFPNVFTAVWFSVVSLTSTGYGDIVPITDTGLVMAIFIMLSGACYLSMPLTAAASTFYRIFEKYNHSKLKIINANLQKEALANQEITFEFDDSFRVKIKMLLTRIRIQLSSITDVMGHLQAPTPAGVNPWFHLHKVRSKAQRKDGYATANEPPSLLSERVRSIFSKTNLLMNKCHNDLLSLGYIHKKWFKSMKAEATIINEVITD